MNKYDQYKHQIEKFLFPTEKLEFSKEIITLKNIQVKIYLGSYYINLIIINQLIEYSFLCFPEDCIFTISELLDKIILSKRKRLSLGEMRLIIYALDLDTRFFENPDFIKYGILFNLEKYFRQNYGL